MSLKPVTVPDFESTSLIASLAPSTRSWSISSSTFTNPARAPAQAPFLQACKRGGLVEGDDREPTAPRHLDGGEVLRGEVAMDEVEQLLVAQRRRESQREWATHRRAVELDRDLEDRRGGTEQVREVLLRSDLPARLIDARRLLRHSLGRYRLAPLPTGRSGKRHHDRRHRTDERGAREVRSNAVEHGRPSPRRRCSRRS